MGAKTVLIVDDDFHIVNALALKFRNSDFNVITAEDGYQALERISETMPDLVITDYQMPVMDGLELVRALRSEQATREIPIILLTAKEQNFEAAGGAAAGVDAIVSKPFSPRAMVSQSRSLIGETP